jgi:hypothetical protein
MPWFFSSCPAPRAPGRRSLPTPYIFIEGRLDAVLHFASPTSPIDCLELPIPALKVGALETRKTLRLAKGKDACFSPSGKAQRELGWGPQYPELRDIVESAWRWHQARPEGYED